MFEHPASVPGPEGDARMREREGFEREVRDLAIPQSFEQESKAGARRCEDQWKKLRAGLPEQARNALDKLDYDLAVLAAIQGGVRSGNVLTDMLFFTQYGPVHGYCRIKKGTRLPGGGDEYAKLWRDLRERHVRPALARPAPPLSQTGPIVCTRRENRLDDPRPDNPGVDVTGRYEEAAPPGRAARFAFRVNQAGNHIECLLRMIAPPGGKSPDAFRLHGDLEPDGSFWLFRRSDPKYLGRFVPPKGGKAGTFALEGRVHEVALVSRSSTVLHPDVLEPLLKLHEQFPLATGQMRHLVDSFASDKVARYLADYFDQPGGSNVSERLGRRQAADRFDSYVRDVFHDKNLGVSQLSRSDMALARFYARTILTDNRWKKRVTRSQLEHIQFLFNRTVREGGSLPYLEDYLGLRVQPEGPEHTYEVTMKLTGGGILVQGYLGTITVKKVSDGGRWAKGHQEKFGVRFLGLEAGWNVKLHEDISGTATSAFEWQPPDFPGPVRMAAAEVGVEYGVGKLSAEAGFLHIDGAGYLPPLQVLFTDVGPGLTVPNPFDGKSQGGKGSKGGGASVEFSIGPSAAFGSIRPKTFPDIDYTTITAKTDYAEAFNLLHETHFCLDSAVLTEPARQALRIAIANELGGFRAPNSFLTIIGHTDRVKDPAYNIGLSHARAFNVLQAIKDILGPVPPHLAVGKGEAEAAAAGDKDNVPNAKRRRVDVVLNGRLILSLRAQ